MPTNFPLNLDHNGGINGAERQGLAKESRVDNQELDPLAYKRQLAANLRRGIEAIKRFNRDAIRWGGLHEHWDALIWQQKYGVDWDEHDQINDLFAHNSRKVLELVKELSNHKRAA